MTVFRLHSPPCDFHKTPMQGLAWACKMTGPVFGFQPILTMFWRSYCPKHGGNSLILASGPKNGAKWQLCAPTQAPMGLPSAKKALHWATQAQGGWIGCFGVNLLESKFSGLSHFLAFGGGFYPNSPWGDDFLQHVYKKHELLGNQFSPLHFSRRPA